MPTPSLNTAARAADWSARHRLRTILGWLAFVVVAFALGTLAGTVLMTSTDLGVGESGQAGRIAAAQFPQRQAGEEVLIQSRHGPLTRPQLQAVVADLSRRLGRVPVVGNISSPLAPGNQGLVAKDGRSALLTFSITGSPDTAKDRVGPALAATAAVQREHPGLFIGEVGDASANKAILALVNQDFRRAEVTSLPVTLVILLLAFGSLIAAGIPLLLGLTAVGAALGMTALASHLLHVDSSVSSVVLLIGLAVGVDYSLFYLRREREERARGLAPADALRRAAATSGRAVLVSGLTVAAAMSGMFLMGSRVFQSFGMGTVLVVLIALVGSLSVLPAILSWLGDRVDRGRLPYLRGGVGSGRSARFWPSVVGAVLRRPLVWGGLAATLLVALALPALRLHTADSGMQSLPRTVGVVRVYDQVTEAFPGQPIAAEVVVSARDVTAPRVQAQVNALERRALASGVLFPPFRTDISGSKQAERISVSLAGTGTDRASMHALGVLRRQVVPATVGSVPGVAVHTGGMTASSADFNAIMKARATYVFAFVFGLAFLLLLLTFRSLVIPIKAIVLNSLSVAAAYGALVLIFQDGRLESLLGFHSFGGITSWVPLFLFVILFGLSMDYHVLILSRVREAYDSGLSSEEAVAEGVQATAGVVTGAAAVMVAVFAIFATMGLVEFKIMGIGLAVAVLLDATVVRAVLLPSAMKLLGDWNWWLPSWLEWLPRVGGEEAVRRGAPVVAAAADEPLPSQLRETRKPVKV
jgi:RND superfamily putative drug exporter